MNPSMPNTPQKAKVDGMAGVRFAEGNPLPSSEDSAGSEASFPQPDQVPKLKQKFPGDRRGRALPPERADSRAGTLHEHALPSAGSRGPPSTASRVNSVLPPEGESSGPPGSRRQRQHCSQVGALPGAASPSASSRGSMLPPTEADGSRRSSAATHERDSSEEPLPPPPNPQARSAPHSKPRATPSAWRGGVAAPRQPARRTSPRQPPAAQHHASSGSSAKPFLAAPASPRGSPRLRAAAHPPLSPKEASSDDAGTSFGLPSPRGHRSDTDAAAVRDADVFPEDDPQDRLDIHFDHEFSKVNHDDFKQELHSSMMSIGCRKAHLSRVTTTPVSSSVVAQMRGPSASIEHMRTLDLNKIQVHGKPPSRVNLRPPPDKELPRERGNSEMERQSFEVLMDAQKRMHERKVNDAEKRLMDAHLMYEEDTKYWKQMVEDLQQELDDEKEARADEAQKARDAHELHRSKQKQLMNQIDQLRRAKPLPVDTSAVEDLERRLRDQDKRHEKELDQLRQLHEAELERALDRGQTTAEALQRELEREREQRRRERERHELELRREREQCQLLRQQHVQGKKSSDPEDEGASARFRSVSPQPLSYKKAVAPPEKPRAVKVPVGEEKAEEEPYMLLPLRHSAIIDALDQAKDNGIHGDCMVLIPMRCGEALEALEDAVDNMDRTRSGALPGRPAFGAATRRPRGAGTGQSPPAGSSVGRCRAGGDERVPTFGGRSAPAAATPPSARSLSLAVDYQAPEGRASPPAPSMEEPSRRVREPVTQPVKRQLRFDPGSTSGVRGAAAWQSGPGVAFQGASPVGARSPRSPKILFGAPKRLC